MRVLSLTVLAASVAACGARGETQFAEQVAVLASEVAPGVERAVGLKFKYPANVAVRSKDDVRRYLLRKMESDFPVEEIERLTLAYRLLRMLPDDLDLQDLLVDLYTEQVVGYYDPELDSLYVVTGADPVELRLIVAHELVHALQAQYVPLDSILRARGDNDRHMAAQAVFEGQGVLASLLALMPNQDLAAVPEFWTEFRQSVRQEQQRMPVLASAPLVLREGLIFPYLGGADFVRWFSKEYPGKIPFGPLLPASTEQILHPEKYREGDGPVGLRFRDGEGILYEDGLGEFETRVLVSDLSGSESAGAATARGWGGDRYGIYGVDGDHGIVWWSVWDTPQAARRFATVLEREWAPHAEAGRDYRITRETVGAYPGVVLVDAPIGWWGLQRTPGVTVDAN